MNYQSSFMIKYKKIAIIAAKNNPEAILRKDKILSKNDFIDITYNHKNVDNVDLVIAIGGDGLMLHLLHEYEGKSIVLYGVNCGTVGFLMNKILDEDLLKNIENCKESLLVPLRMNAIAVDGTTTSLLAINEVSLLRQSSQASRIKIIVNGKERVESLVGDGVLLSTSAGSTAYNFSAGGPIIPFGAKILALTAISAFRPRNFRSVLLPASSVVRFEILDYEKRPVSATADFTEIKNIKAVEVFEDKEKTFRILFDPNHSLEERIIREQFFFPA